MQIGDQEYAQLLKDALRYRWLRAANYIMPGTPGKPMIEWYCGTDLDTAIDSAREHKDELKEGL